VNRSRVYGAPSGADATIAISKRNCGCTARWPLKTHSDERIRLTLPCGTRRSAPDPANYSVSRKTEAIEAVLARLRAAPSVQSVGFTRAGVLIPEEIFVGTFVPQRRTLDEVRADPLKPRLRPATDGYLTAMGVRLLDVRELAPIDAGSSPPVMVISRTVARRYFGSGKAVGQSVNWYVGKGPAVPVRVVGVVEDVRNESPDREANPDIFIDYRQLLELSRRWGDPPQRQDEMACASCLTWVRRGCSVRTSD
jgi:hypothetical protein